MGTRGPKPLPSNVHLLRGNPSKKSLADLTDDLQPEVEIPSLPKHLLPEAKKEWKRIASELLRYGVVSKLDRAALALYVQEWAWLVWHEMALQRDIKIAEIKRAEFEAKENAKVAAALYRGEDYVAAPFLGGDGFMLPTPNGSFTYNPHWVARNKHAAGVDKFQASFGMSPSSRGRVSPSSRQGSLFDPDNPDAWKDF
jgi:phage terminase small subunit